MFTVKTSDNSPFIKRTTPHFIASTSHHPLILPALHLHFAGIWSIYSIFPFFFWQVLYQLLFSIHGILIFGRLSVFIDIGVTVLAHEHKEHTNTTSTYNILQCFHQLTNHIFFMYDQLQILTRIAANHTFCNLYDLCLEKKRASLEIICDECFIFANRKNIFTAININKR